MSDMVNNYDFCFFDDDDDVRPAKSKFKACIKCGKKGLVWKQIDYGSSIKWRLADKKTGEVHFCVEPKARGGLKPKK